MIRLDDGDKFLLLFAINMKKIFYYKSAIDESLVFFPFRLAARRAGFAYFSFGEAPFFLLPGPVRPLGGIAGSRGL